MFVIFSRLIFHQFGVPLRLPPAWHGGRKCSNDCDPSKISASPPPAVISFAHDTWCHDISQVNHCLLCSQQHVSKQHPGFACETSTIGFSIRAPPRILHSHWVLLLFPLILPVVRATCAKVLQPSLILFICIYHLNTASYGIPTHVLLFRISMPRYTNSGNISLRPLIITNPYKWNDG